MKLRSALLAATVMVAPVAAMAQPISGLYIGAGVGANFMPTNQSVSSVGFPGLAPGSVAAGTGSAIAGAKLHLDPGFVGVASVGYGLGNGLRFELEGNYRSNKLNKLDLVGGGKYSAGGDEMKYGVMVNALYDINLASMGVSFPVVPYVGVGAGYSWVQQRNSRFYGNTGPQAGAPAGYANQFRSNDTEGAFAYQAILGAALPIASVPGLALTLEYRFMGLAGDRTYNYQYLSPAPLPVGTATRSTVKLEDNFNHAVMVGVRYAFNAAPPPVIVPVAPPVSQAARTYLVFFDWDRADLTDRARQIIAEAAQATTKVQVTRIEVSGHTDTTGTAKYNQGLSVRRAQNVAAELVRLGVPRAAITTQGFGFSKPLVATGPGVREPQNRRVEIVLK